MAFGPHFKVQNLFQNESTWPPKANPRSYDSEEKRFKKVLFCIVFTILLEHQASQESLKTAKKPPKVPPDGHQEFFQKRVHFLTPLWVPK